MTTPHAALRAIYEGQVSVIREFRGGSRLDAPDGVDAGSVMRLCAWGFASRCDPESVGAYSVFRIALTLAGIEALEAIEDRQ